MMSASRIASSTLCVTRQPICSKVFGTSVDGPPSVARVDDVGLHHAREKMRRAGRAVADDDEIRVERLEVSGRVLEGLALFKRRGVGGKIHDVGGQPLLGQFKTDARARGGLD